MRNWLYSIALFIWGMVRRMITLLPWFLSDPFDIADRFNIQYNIAPIVSWLLLGCGIVASAVWLYHDLRQEKITVIGERDRLQEQIDEKPKIEERMKIRESKIQHSKQHYEHMMNVLQLLSDIQTQSDTLADNLGNRSTGFDELVKLTSLHNAGFRERMRKDLNDSILSLQKETDNIGDYILSDQINSFLGKIEFVGEDRVVQKMIYTFVKENPNFSADKANNLLAEVETVRSSQEKDLRKSHGLISERIKQLSIGE